MLPIAQTSLGRILRMPLRLVPKKAVIPVLSGRVRGAKWVVGSHTHGCWLGTYERHTQELFADLVGPGDVVYDVGAHSGYFALLASRLVGDQGSVIAFEPQARNLVHLEAHIQMNGVRVAVVPEAVGATAGVAKFAATTSASGGLRDDGELSVSVTTIDAAVAGGRSVPTFIKIDVEGAEAEVLHGARETLIKHRPKLLVSLHTWKAQDACVEILRSLGYALVRPNKGAYLAHVGKPIAVMDGEWRSELSP